MARFAASCLISDPKIYSPSGIQILIALSMQQFLIHTYYTENHFCEGQLDMAFSYSLLMIWLHPLMAEVGLKYKRAFVF